jgi:aromatic-L-amino-acid decarboxylase
MPDAPAIPHMSPDEFRRQGYALIDTIADYWSRVGEYPVLSQAKPGDISAQLPISPPAQPGNNQEWDAIRRDLDQIIMPGITHWQSPRFFGFFPANISGPSVLGELLSAGLGVQGMLWLTSPACTELETRVLDWLAQMLNLPPQFHSTSSGGGVIHGTASEAALVALVAARHRLRAQRPDQPDVASRLTIYCSQQAHSSIVKAAMIAGHSSGPHDHSRVRLIDVDANGQMRMDLFQQAIAADLTAGLIPGFVCATVGTTGTTAIDPIPAIAAILREHAPHCWLHIDAAHAGAAAICPELRPMLDGIEDADSFCFNPHKWLLTNFDCDCFYVRDRRVLIDSLSITPEYLRNAASDSGEVFDYRDWQVPLGRRFRALKLWFVIRHYGVSGLQSFIRQHNDCAAQFESWVRADSRFELVAPRTMNLVCFRLKNVPGAPDRNRELLAAVNATGRIYLTHTALPPSMGGFPCVLRMAIGGTLTTLSDVQEAWQILQSQAAALPTAE